MNAFIPGDIHWNASGHRVIAGSRSSSTCAPSPRVAPSPPSPP